MEKAQALTVNVAELMSVCVQLAYQACIVINRVRESEDIGIQAKGYGDCATAADIEAQALIMRGLHRFWPNLRIIGEEDKKFKGELAFDVARLDPKLITEEDIDYKKGPIPPLDTQNVIVWVDPLDATSNFIRKQLEPVTSLIGVSYKGVPVLGAIGVPYEVVRTAGEQQTKETYNFNPSVYYGGTAVGRQNFVCVATHAELSTGAKLTVKPLERPKTPASEVVCELPQYLRGEKNRRFVESLPHDKVSFASGAGKKQLNCVLGKSTYYMYPGGGTARWDICAGDALLLAYGGVCGGVNGQQYVYDEQEKNIYNDYGFMGSLDDKLWPRIVEQMKANRY